MLMAPAEAGCVFLKPLLLALPLERTPRELDLGLRHDGLDWLARTDPADDGDRGRIARLAQIDPDKVTRRGAAALEARAHRLEVDLPRAAAAIRAPDRDCERENEIIVFAGPGVEGEVSCISEINPELLQLAHGFRQLFLDLQPAFVQQR